MIARQFSKQRVIVTMVILALLSPPFISPAATYTVPGNYSTIQNAIDALGDGDEIVVSPGTYIETIDFKGKDIFLRSLDPTSSVIRSNTVIDGNKGGSVVTFAGSEVTTCVLSGFTLTNGYGLHGGAIDGNGTLATIAFNNITSNTAYGPISNGDGGAIHDCDGIIQNNSIIGNSAVGNISTGGALFGCDGDILSNIISYNSCLHAGAGLNSCEGLIKNNTISFNSTYRGAGIADCDGTIDNNIIHNNRANLGGGIHNCDGLIQNNTIEFNTVLGSYLSGGGLYECNGTIQKNIIKDNYAYWGGGIALCNGSILNNVIWHNIARHRGGGLFNCDNGIITNNTIWGNTSEYEGSGLYGCDSTVRNCIIWQNTAPHYSQIIQGSGPRYCCVENWTSGGEGNITDNPQLMDISAGDFHLLSTSPCIDAGCTINIVTEDFEGEPRPFDGTGEPRGDGSDFDIGADEYFYGPTPTPTATPTPSPTPSSPTLFCAVGWNGEFTHINSGVGQIAPTRSDLPQYLQALSYSPTNILYTGKGGDLYTIQPMTGNITHFLSITSDIRGMAFSDEGILYITSGHSPQTLRIINLSTGNNTDIGTLWGDGNAAQGLAFSPEGKLYGVCPHNQTVFTFDLFIIDIDDAEMHLIGGNLINDLSQSIAFTQDGRLFALGDEFAELNPNNGMIIGPVYSLTGDFRGLEKVITPTPTVTPTPTPTETPSPTLTPLVHFTFESGDEGWRFAGTVPPYDIPTSACQNGVLGLSPSGSTNAFSYWYSPDVTIEDGNLYRARWTVGSTCSNADETIDFRLRVNQKGSWQAWNRVVNSNNNQAPSAMSMKSYNLFFNPNVTGVSDSSIILNFDIMSFSFDNNTQSWLFLDELVVDMTSIQSSNVILEYTFETGPEDWLYGGTVPPFDSPIISVPAGKIGLSPNGSANCFSYIYGPDAGIAGGTIYRTRFEIGSSVDNSDEAIQFRTRVNQKGSWQAWDRVVASNNEQAPSISGSKVFDVIFDPAVTGTSDNQSVFSFDIMSFDWNDSINSWLYLDSVTFEEVQITP